MDCAAPSEVVMSVARCCHCGAEHRDLIFKAIRTDRSGVFSAAYQALCPITGGLHLIADVS